MNKITLTDKTLNLYSKAVAVAFRLCYNVNPKSGFTINLKKHYISTRQKITEVYCVIGCKQYIHYGNHTHLGMTAWKLSQGWGGL